MTDENATTADENIPTAALEPQPEDAPRAEEPRPRPEEARAEEPPAPATPAPPPAEELIATAEVREERAAEHAAPALEQLPPDEAPAAALPPHEPEAEQTDAVAEQPPPLPEPEVAEPAAEPAAEPETQPKPTAPKKPRKSAKTAAVAPAPDAAVEPAPTAAADEPAPDAAAVGAEPTAEPAPESKKKWYAVKIQSGREESIKAAIERKVKIEALEPFFGQIVIPVEEVIVKKKVKVKNKKTGETTTQEKNVTKYNKKFPGYLFAEVEFNDEILYVFRETSGVGDFVGVNTKKTQGAIERQPPPPMTDAEVTSMLTGAPAPGGPRKGKGGKVVVKLDVEKGDKVRIRNGAFVGSEGEVKSITEPKDPTETPKVTVVVTLWGRPVEVELDYWEVDKV